jgi:hypothetical protein
MKWITAHSAHVGGRKWKFQSAAALLLATLLTAVPATAQTAVIYVDISTGVLNPADQGRGGWGTDAYKYLQDALTGADYLIDNEIASDVEIWVAAGTYLPTQNVNCDWANCTLGTCCDVAVSFELRNHVAIYGGFAGTESSLELRDWITNVTILSGDLNDDDDFYEDDGFQYDNYDDNTHHVVRGTEIGPTAILDGFTVRGGRGDGLGIQGGGGYLGEDASPVIRNVRFIEHTTSSTGLSEFGAGAHVISNASGSPVFFHNCLFKHNRAEKGSGGLLLGSAVTEAVLIGCDFIANTTGASTAAKGCGAACWTGADKTTFVNCRFAANHIRSNVQSGEGAALCISGSVARVWSCLFHKNTAANENLPQDPGTLGVIGIASGVDGAIEIINCTITDNYAGAVGGVYAASTTSGFQLNIHNSIIYGNGGD